MHILWLVRTTLPQAAAACGLAGASDVSGSWLTGQLAALRACPDLHLTVLCVGKEDADGTADGVHYRVVRDTAAFAPLLQAERPDLVHIWGTEFDPAAVMAEATPISDWQPPMLPAHQACPCCSAYRALCGTAPRTSATACPKNTAVPVRCGTPLIKSFPASCSTTCRRALTHWPQRRPQRWPTPAM